MQSETRELLKAAIRNPRDVATIFPTSKFLAQALLDQVAIRPHSFVVEVGVGTGAITKYILPRLNLRPEQYLGVEIDPQMVAFLKAKFPHLQFQAGSVHQLDQIMQGKRTDAIVSSLPWTVFDKQFQQAALQSIYNSLADGGVFVTYMCLNSSWYPQAKFFKKRLYELFSKVEQSPIEWRNIPPAFILKATK